MKRPKAGLWQATRTETSDEIPMTFPGGWLVKRIIYVPAVEYGAVTRDQHSAEVIADLLNNAPENSFDFALPEEK